MDPIKSIGSILTGDEQKDAIHIAIMPVIADEDIDPGAHLKLVYGTTDRVRIANYDNPKADRSVGIADPFIADRYKGIKKGDKFWMFLYPATITGIRHEWKHPTIDNPISFKSESELWMHKFADNWGFDYDLLLEAGKGGNNDYITAHGVDLHSRDELGEDHDLFWEHLEKLTGRHVGPEGRESFTWSCSC